MRKGTAEDKNHGSKDQEKERKEMKERRGKKKKKNYAEESREFEARGK